METSSSESLGTEKKTQNVIREKSAEILEPPGKAVFYNPVQEFNRDLSVLALQVFSKEIEDKNVNSNKGLKTPLKILEAFSATGLRSIRYAKEVPNVSEVVANDWSSQAFENIKENIRHNNVENIVKPNHADAMSLMINSIRQTDKFLVVDIDPYGSPAQFLDSAVQCVADGGMIFVTSTDMPVLCGVFPETCYARYGVLSLRHPALHEMAIRIILSSIQAHASRYKRYIVPVLSVCVDFYVRVFVKIYTSPIACKEVFRKVSMVHLCTGCTATVLQPLGIKKEIDNGKKVEYALPHVPEFGGKCIHCGSSQQMGGPIWNGPIHDRNFVAEMIKLNEKNEFGTSKRILGVLTLVQEELLDVPLYYLMGPLSKVVKTSQMPATTIRSALLNAGYRVSFSHTAPQSLKTDAPMSFIWDVFRQWMKENPKKECNILPGSPGEKISKTPIQNKIDFSNREDANPLSREVGLLRYQKNPAPNWGPGSKSTTRILGEPGTKRKRSE